MWVTLNDNEKRNFKLINKGILVIFCALRLATLNQTLLNNYSIPKTLQGIIFEIFIF